MEVQSLRVHIAGFHRQSSECEASVGVEAISKPLSGVDLLDLRSEADGTVQL